jgi:hypothetical protein
MAKTSKYGFIYKRNLSPNVEDPMRIEVILANSAGPLTIGDTVKWSSGYLDGCAADYAMLGILEGFVCDNGENLFKSTADNGGTTSGDDTFTAASDNVTVHKVKGVVNIDPNALFQAYADSALTQAEVGLWFNTSAIDGTYPDGVTGTGAAWSVGTQVMQLIELVTTLEDGSTSTTTGLFRIGRSQLLNDVTI